MVMKQEDLENLLKTNTEDQFMNIIYKQNEDYENNRELWTEEMIEHLLSITDLTRKEFEWSFTLEPPIDNFDD